jgi:phage terminase small subunit
MPGRRRAYTPKELTEKQKMFVEKLTDTKSDTFANIVKAMQTAGYKHGNSPRLTAINLLANQNILTAILTGVQKAQKYGLIRQETAKEKIWNELEEALIECKPREKQSETGEIVTIPGDMTNRLRVIELMGKFHQLWSDKVTISVETYEKMTSEHLAELRELSKLRLLGSNAEPIQACFETVSVDMDIPDIACDSIEQQDIINNTPVSHETLDVKYSDDNDLQSNESDNANATQQTL